MQPRRADRSPEKSAGADRGVQSAQSPQKVRKMLVSGHREPTTARTHKRRSNRWAGSSGQVSGSPVNHVGDDKESPETSTRNRPPLSTPEPLCTTGISLFHFASATTTAASSRSSKAQHRQLGDGHPRRSAASSWAGVRDGCDFGRTVVSAADRKVACPCPPANGFQPPSGPLAT